MAPPKSDIVSTPVNDPTASIFTNVMFTENSPTNVNSTTNITTNTISTASIPQSISTESISQAVSTTNNTLNVATLNIRGQTGLNISKQKQIEAFIKLHSIDILHCQEIAIEESTFESCNFLTSSFDIIQNNSPNNRYGTASLLW